MNAFTLHLQLMFHYNILAIKYPLASDCLHEWVIESFTRLIWYKCGFIYKTPLRAVQTCSGSSVALLELCLYTPDSIIAK